MTKISTTVMTLLMINILGLIAMGRVGSVQAQNYSSTQPVTATAQRIVTPVPTPTTVPVVVATPVPTPTPLPVVSPSPVVVAVTPSPAPSSLPVTAGASSLPALLLTLGIATCIFTVYRLKLGRWK